VARICLKAPRGTGNQLNDAINYYSFLGIGRTARPEEIKRAYRKMVFRYHPDRNPDDLEAAEKLKQVLDAYEVLSDEEKRAQYDWATRGKFEADEDKQEQHNDATGGFQFSYEFKHKVEPEPKCPGCSAVGIHAIVARKGGTGTSRGKQFILSPFNVVFCNQCGHVYGITGTSG